MITTPSLLLDSQQCFLFTQLSIAATRLSRFFHSSRHLPLRALSLYLRDDFNVDEMAVSALDELLLVARGNDRRRRMECWKVLGKSQAVSSSCRHFANSDSCLGYIQSHMEIMGGPPTVGQVRGVAAQFGPLAAAEPLHDVMLHLASQLSHESMKWLLGSLFQDLEAPQERVNATPPHNDGRYDPQSEQL